MAINALPSFCFYTAKGNLLKICVDICKNFQLSLTFSEMVGIMLLKKQRKICKNFQ